MTKNAQATVVIASPWSSQRRRALDGEGSLAVARSERNYSSLVMVAAHFRYARMTSMSSSAARARFEFGFAAGSRTWKRTWSSRISDVSAPRQAATVSSTFEHSSPLSTQLETLRLHQANERTMLAWLRTGIALMAFGFAIARFGVFLGQVAAVGSLSIAAPRSLGSAWLGAALVAAGMMMSATLRFRQVREGAGGLSRGRTDGFFRRIARYMPAAPVHPNVSHLETS
jgi:uncharacterized membrane protein YidH (DUF202 family)